MTAVYFHRDARSVPGTIPTHEQSRSKKPMTPTSVTIKEIARMLGVSKSTVSRALTRQTDVNSETRRKILELAESLNYQPNSLALNLRHKRTKTLGVIIPETINTFFSRAVGGIQKVANSQGYNVIVCQSNESSFAEKSTLHSLVSNRADGLLISISRETENDEHFQTLLDKHIPVVFFDRICERLETTQVMTDNFEISREATQHLLAEGCQRIAMLTGPLNLHTSAKRLEGYMDALRRNNIEVDQSLIFNNFRTDDVDTFVRHILSAQALPDAIFAVNDMTAIEIMHALRKAGLKIPQDVAVMGFNNERFGAFIEPSLTTIDLPAQEMGATAAELLLAHIKDPTCSVEKRLIKSRVIIRDSTRKTTLTKKPSESVTL